MTHIIYLCIIAALILYCIHLRKNQKVRLPKTIEDFTLAVKSADYGWLPDGYKHDSDLGAIVREPATTHYPTMAKKPAKRHAKKRPTMSKRKK